MKQSKSLLLIDHEPSWMRMNLLWRARHAFNDPLFTFDTVIENVYSLYEQLDAVKWKDPSYRVPTDNAIIQTLLSHDLFIDTSIERSETGILLHLYLSLIIRNAQPGTKNLYFLRSWNDIRKGPLNNDLVWQYLGAGHKIWTWDPAGFESVYTKMHGLVPAKWTGLMPLA